MKHLQILLAEWKAHKTAILLRKPVTPEQIQEVLTLSHCITELELAISKESK